jgi:hypothetical protein
MKKILYLIGFINSFCYAVGYAPTDLDKFNNTNVCSGCDLSGATLTGNHSHADLSNSNCILQQVASQML